MKKSIITFVFSLLAASMLMGCNYSERRDMGMVAGGVVGGVAGSALTGGSTAGTVVGAVGGGYVGRQLSH